MILYVDDIVLLCNNIDKLMEVRNDKPFVRFGLKISTDKTKIMVFNIPEEIKAKLSLISIGAVTQKMYTLLNTSGHDHK